MFKVLKKSVLSENVKRMEVLAPDIARRARAGQFIVLRVAEDGERIPVTIAGTDSRAGSITIIFQEVGKTTHALGRLEAGEAILDVLGPLGCCTEPFSGGTIVAVAGGVGVAEILPVSRMFTENDNRVIGIVGARNRDLIILEKEMREACAELHIATDDGSYGRKGFVSDVLKELLGKGEKVDLVYAIGPVPMMKAISALTKPFGVKTVVSLNPIMVDGTGMCGACRVTVGGETKFSCVDGPEFDGHAVDWDELIMRLSAFKPKERVAFENYQRVCTCNHQG